MIERVTTGNWVAHEIQQHCPVSKSYDVIGDEYIYYMYIYIYSIIIICWEHGKPVCLDEELIGNTSLQAFDRS